MDDITKRDRLLFTRELFTFWRIVLYGAILTVIGIPWIRGSGTSIVPLCVTSAVLLAASTMTAWDRSKEKRFKSERFRLIWRACQERQKRFHQGLRAVSKRGIAELQELPQTIDAIGVDLYCALRRADNVATEVVASEGWLIAQPPTGQAMSPDRQAQELYKLADKNIAEYRQHYQSVMAGVERTEAQIAVYTTTLDTLRMKMLGYRLVGKDTESPTQEFLAALTEARMQLDSIDKALDELELTPFPRTYSTIPGLQAGPPPLPDHVQELVRGKDDTV
ncbi:MAG: hypothetical protein JNM34_00420 [Chthonomonadaceae bacterium]|nr:hypothetical protein [Chthonomonadaceae bacterium]